MDLSFVKGIQANYGFSPSSPQGTSTHTTLRSEDQSSSEPASGVDPVTIASLNARWYQSADYAGVPEAAGPHALLAKCHITHKEPREPSQEEKAV
jgi:hypothetical protein